MMKFLGIILFFISVSSFAEGFSFQIRGVGLDPEKVRTFNQILLETKSNLPNEIMKKIPKEVTVFIKTIPGVKKDIKDILCSDSTNKKSEIPYSYTKLNKRTNTIVIDRSLFQEIISTKEEKLSNCITTTTKEFGLKSIVYEISRLFFNEVRKESKISTNCWEGFINRFSTGKLTMKGTKSLVGSGCRDKIFNDLSLPFSEDFFQLTFIPRSIKNFDVGIQRELIFANETANYLTQNDYLCERPSLGKLYRDFYGESNFYKKSLNCKDTNTFYLGQFPFDQRTLDKNYIKSLDLIHVKPENILSGKGKLYLKVNICKEKLKKNDCVENRYESYWLGFKEEVEELLISLNRKGYYARAFGVDDIIARRELSENLFQDYDLIRLNMNRDEIDKTIDLMKELIWNSKSQYSFITPSNLLEFQDIFTYGMEGLVFKDKYFSSIPSFVEMLKKNNRVRTIIPFESSLKQLKVRYDFIRNKLVKSGKNISLPSDPIDFLEMRIGDQLDAYHDWVQSTRDFATEDLLKSVVRRKEQKDFVQNFVFLADKAMKYKFLKRRKDLTGFLNKLSKSDEKLDQKFKYYINQGDRRIPFYDDLISLSDYLSKRDENQERVEMMIFNWNSDSKLLKKYPEIVSLKESGIDLIDTQKLLKDKFEEEIAQVVYLYKTSFDTYLKNRLEDIYKRNYQYVEQGILNDKELKKLRERINLKPLGQGVLSNRGLKLLVENFLKSKRDVIQFEDFR